MQLYGWRWGGVAPQREVGVLLPKPGVWMLSPENRGCLPGRTVLRNGGRGQLSRTRSAPNTGAAKGSQLPPSSPPSRLQNILFRISLFFLEAPGDLPQAKGVGIKGKGRDRLCVQAAVRGPHGWSARATGPLRLAAVRWSCLAFLPGLPSTNPSGWCSVQILGMYP